MQNLNMEPGVVISKHILVNDLDAFSGFPEYALPLSPIETTTLQWHQLPVQLKNIVV